MRVSRAFERLVGTVVRRPLPVVAVVAVLAVAGAALAVATLRPTADPGTFVDRSSPSFGASERAHERFGDDAVLVLVREPLTRLVLTADLGRLLALEGCLSGNAPAGATFPGGPRGPCAALARSKPVQVVYGPGTFLNEAVRQIQGEFALQQAGARRRENAAARKARQIAKDQGRSAAEQDAAAAEARQLVQKAFLRDTLRLALQYNIRSQPRIDDPSFVANVVFDAKRGASVPKARFAYLFPNSRSAVVQVRMKPGLSDAARRRAIGQIRAAARLPTFKLAAGTYTVTGAPVLVGDLTAEISRSILLLLGVAIVVMAAVLLLAFRSTPPRTRLVPLGAALAAVALLFGAMAVAGLSLTMASIAVLPILIGLGVDYAIQFQSRFDEARVEGLAPERAAVVAVTRSGPTIGTACLATAAGFLVLLLSPVPMVRGFGALLVVGVAIGFAVAVTAGFALLVLAAGAGRVPGGLRRAGAAAGASLRGAGDIAAEAARGASRLLRGWPGRAAAATGRAGRASGRRIQAAWSRLLGVAVQRPGRVLAIAGVAAAIGLAVDTQTEVVSDVQALVPQDLPAQRDISSLQRTTGVYGEADVLVEADDVTQPAVVRWMTGYQTALLARYGYSPDRGCGKAALCPALSLPDLFRVPAQTRTRERIRALLDEVPPYFSQAVISPDRRAATLAFGVRLAPLDEQQKVFDEMRRRLEPPPGVRATLAGLPVLAADANAKVSSPWRRLLTLAASLALVALVLLAAFRTPRRALVPLVPIALATGWSALVLFLTRIPLNPMSVTLGALVVAITTEFSVLLSERCRQEREGGCSLAEALERTYASTGRAVLASGATAIAGFAVLAVSDIRMLRDFGLVTVVDLAVSLLGVMLVLPAVLALVERGARVPRPGAVTGLAGRLRPRRPRATA